MSTICKCKTCKLYTILSDLPVEILDPRRQAQNGFCSYLGADRLSSALATVWIQQLAVVWAFLAIKAERKDREVYLRDFSMKCRSRIVNLLDIPLELTVTSMTERNGRHFFRGDYDIDVGSFVGAISWVMDTQPLVLPHSPSPPC